MSSAPTRAGVPPVDRWPLRGGSACLDFANTVGWRPTPRPVDALRAYEDLIVWARHAGLLELAQADRLRQRAAADDAGAAAALAAALALREAIHRLFAALAHGAAIDEGDLATIDAILVEGLARAALVPENGGFAFHLPSEEDALSLPLWLLAESAARLLVSGEWRRVRECPGHDCGWLFLDTTRNGNRRWCDSADCGNRARVRSHEQRRRAASRARDNQG